MNNQHPTNTMQLTKNKKSVMVEDDTYYNNTLTGQRSGVHSPHSEKLQIKPQKTKLRSLIILAQDSKEQEPGQPSPFNDGLNGRGTAVRVPTKTKKIVSFSHRPYQP
jgi:hypothetical protein